MRYFYSIKMNSHIFKLKQKYAHVENSFVALILKVDSGEEKNINVNIPYSDAYRVKNFLFLKNYLFAAFNIQNQYK